MTIDESRHQRHVAEIDDGGAGGHGDGGAADDDLAFVHHDGGVTNDAAGLDVEQPRSAHDGVGVRGGGEAEERKQQPTGRHGAGSMLTPVARILRPVAGSQVFSLAKRMAYSARSASAGAASGSQSESA